ncbi:hypothetical protein Aab01nite_63420 [Paractinoplanes abujensis]|uniref:Uncharacterized protein n=1 Tax=Paractinoplanes abujensis TaxID=882441 RepID=A0A7W7CQU3_9ACTN|nr:hypothetical protein [Actinoplanes abujensis]GID22752.1 hypothetical protein Aab01nite_63420 [Actinoplanes abujensis]
MSLCWFTRSGASAAHTLSDQAHSTGWGRPVAVPQACAVFGSDETARRLIPAPPEARWAEFAHGGRFPALEAPADLAADLPAFFAPLQGVQVWAAGVAACGSTGHCGPRGSA